MIDLFLTLPLVLATTPAQGSAAPEQDQARAVSVPSLAGEIDLTLRWLRARQKDDGSYGSASATAQVLLALADSHRAYRPADGPFVSGALDWLALRQDPNGSIADEGVSLERRKAQTLTAKMALDRLGGGKALKASARAAKFLGLGDVALEDAGTQYRDVANDALLDMAALSLAKRHAEGYWGEADVAATAATLEQLNVIHRVLRARKSAGEPAQARPLPAYTAADRERTARSLRRGAAFLLEQAEDGKWGFQGRPDAGITAMVAGALLSVPEPRPADVQKAIDGALDWLVSQQHADGSIHQGQLANYVTSASILALAKAKRSKDADAIAKAREFLRVLQADEGEGYAQGDRFYGGVGYGGDERPDLSNMQMALEALNAAGLDSGDESFQKALVFLRRCQNNSETNDLTLSQDGVTFVSGNDGGAGYAPGDSKAGFIELPDGKQIPRSYGSMTYALLKGYLFAGLPRDDPRVEAAWKWLTKNYTLDVNPGFEASSRPTDAYQGLYYYFYTMARALDLYGAEVIVDGFGKEHAWRAELSGRLVAMQRQDGSWINENASRWYEGNPVLATGYAMVTLRTAMP